MMPSTLEREGPTVIATLITFLAGEGLDGQQSSAAPMPEMGDESVIGWPVEAWDGFKG